MNKTEKPQSKPFYYNKKYVSFTNKKEAFFNRIKGKILELISKSKKLSNKLGLWEAFELRRSEWVKKYIYFKDEFSHKDDEYSYKEIELTHLNFYEVIEIDDFERFRRKVIAKFGNNPDLIGFKRDGELKEKLSGIETKFSNITIGRNLFYINFKKSPRSNNDLISSINCNYIKTNESYFILTFEVTLSKKANEIYTKIINQEHTGLSVPQYNSFLTILRKRSFYTAKKYILSLKEHNLQNLISDISTQVKKNITKHFNGYFHNSKIFESLPHIEFFNVENINEFRKDKTLVRTFGDGYNSNFSLEDKEIEIYLSDSKDRAHYFQVVKQKGHGIKKDKSKKDLTNYDNVESVFLLESLSFPCAFSAILKEQSYKITTLKRSIYDQIRISNERVLFKNFRLNKKYFSLKNQLIQILLIVKRFESEFTERNIGVYTRETKLSSFKNDNKFNEENENLLSYFISNFKYRMERQTVDANKINEIFKPLEELNSYKTNLALQRFSILLAILGVIFIFKDEIFKYLSPLIKWIISLF